MSGYIKMYRKLLDWQWFNVDYMVRVWIYILMKVSYDGGYYGTVKVDKGQMVTGRKKMAADLNLSEQQIRTALDRLKATNEITIQSTNKYSVITVVNWADYQCDSSQSTNGITTTALNEQPTNNQQITTNKEIKKVKKVKKNIYTNENDLPKYNAENNPVFDEERFKELMRRRT